MAQIIEDGGEPATISIDKVCPRRVFQLPKLAVKERTEKVGAARH